MLTFLLFVIGFFMLIKGADLLVEGGVAIANRFKVSHIVTGLTIVAFGTSMPEFVVSFAAGLKGSADITLGNVVGSNMVNLLLILGVAAVIFPFTVKSDTTWKEVPLSLIAAIIMFVLINDKMLGANGDSSLTMGDGMVMLAFFAIFVAYVLSIAQNDRALEVPQVENELKGKSLLRPISYVVLGIIIMAIGGNWIVEGAIVMARMLHVSEALIGLTIVALGTSLPELATTVVASMKKHSDLAIGNVIGSNIFNIFWILGITTLVSPVALNPNMNFDMVLLIGVSLLLFVLLYGGKSRHFLSRGQGVLLIVIYVAYTAFKIYTDSGAALT